MRQETLWLRAHVRQCLQEAWDVERTVVDADGDVPFRAGSAAGWVSTVDLGELRVVRVWAHAACDVKGSASVLREINEVNSRTLTAHVYWSGGLVVVEQTMLADAVTTATLEQAWRAVSLVANDVGPMVAAVHGGSTPFPVEDEPADDRESVDDEEGEQ